MCAFRASKVALAALPYPNPTTDVRSIGTARCTANWGRCGAVVKVQGELDAANTGQMTEYVQHCAAECEWLVLDLEEVTFIGTDGFSALKMIGKQCASDAIYCTTVPGRAVRRLLQICDTAGSVSTTTSLTEALADAQDLPWPQARARL